MADAQASGACDRKAVWVQVPSPALQHEVATPETRIFRGRFALVYEIEGR